VEEFRAVRLILYDLLRTGLRGLRAYLTIQLVAIVALVILVVYGVLDSFFAQGWASVASNLSENIAASALVAATTVIGFLVSIQRRAISRVLDFQRREYVRSEHLPLHRLGQARAVVAQLRDHSQPGSLLIEATDASARDTFLRELITVLTDQSIIAIVLPGRALLDSQAGAAALEAFRRMLALAAVPDAPLSRTFESLARRRRAVVIVNGLDESDQQITSGSGVDLVRGRVSELQVARLPFIATIEPGAVPDQLRGSRMTLLPLTGAALEELAASRPGQPGDARVWSADPMRLAEALRVGSVSLRRIERELTGGTSPGQAQIGFADNLLEGVRTYGPLAAHVRTLLDTGFLGAFRAGWSWQHPADASAALEEIASRLLRFDGKSLDWADLMTSAPPAVADRLLSGVYQLENLGLIDRVVSSLRVQLRFCEPELRELVVGAWAATSSLPFGYTAARSSAAFSGEALHRMMLAGRRAAQVWQEVLDLSAARGLLVVVTDVARAYGGITDGRRPEFGASWLAPAWERASDGERTAFLWRLPDALPGEITGLLWQQLIPPRFAVTSHSVRRVIARRLGRSGETTWSSLQDTWSDLVQIAAGDGLAWHERNKPTWRQHGSAIASLCWVLPSVTLTCRPAEREQAARLLLDLTAAVTPGSGPERSGRPDLGVEISLAEGLKELCDLALVRAEPLPAVTWEVIRALGLSGTSWITRLLALQAAALAVASDRQCLPECLALCATLSGREHHPLVRQYSRIVTAALGGDSADYRLAVYSVVWVDDTETLETGGGELTDAATRVLGMATLVLNLVEARIRSGGDQQKQQLARARALAETVLPRCLTSPVLASAFGRLECQCTLGLCGPDLLKEARRPISRVFAYRCLSPSAARPGATPAARLAERWSGQAAASHFRRLARQEGP
jgi:hypothetical protein